MANRKLRVVLTTLAVTSGGVATAAIVGACSASTGPSPGAVMVAIDTNMKVPDDIDEIGISASLANVDGGTVWENTAFELKPKTNDVFPATFAVVRGTDQPVAIRVVGYKDGVPLTLRDAVVTLPPDRTAVLRMPIDWLDKGSAVAPTTTKDLSTAASSSTLPLDCSSICPSGQTSVAGTCQAYGLQTNLPDYDPRAFPSSENSSACLDVDACFPNFNDGSLDVKLDKSTCSFVPTLAPTQMNVAIRLGPVGNGWGNGYGHVMPLAQDPTDGWSLSTNGAVILPPSVCTNAKILGVIVTASSDKCPFKAIDVPACQIYPDASSTNPPAIDSGAAMDATMEMATDARADDASVDADASTEIDAGPTYDPTVYQASVTSGTPVAFASDNGNLYVVTNLVSQQLFLHVGSAMFDSGVLTTAAPVLDELTPTPVMASYGGYVGISGASSFELVAADGGALTDSGTFYTSSPLTTLVAFPGDAGGPVFLGATTAYDFVTGQPNGSGREYRRSIQALAIDPKTQASMTPQFAMSIPNQGLDSGSILYAPIDFTMTAGGISASQIVATVAAFATQVTFADESHVAWTDKDGRVCITETTSQADAGGTCIVDGGASTGANTFGGGGGVVFFIGPGNVIYKAGVGADAGASESLGMSANILFVSGNQLYWANSSTVFRRDLRSFP